MQLGKRTLALRTTAALAAVLGAATAAAQPAVSPGNSGLVALGRDGVIDQPGHYVLNRDLDLNATAGRAGVMITADGVTLDLNGHNITGPGSLEGVGVMVEGARGVTIRNGRIADFGLNVHVLDSANVVLEDLQISGQGIPVAAPPPEIGVMIEQSANVTVRDNNFWNVGLGVFVRGGQSRGNRIVENTLTSAGTGLLGICYNPTASDPQGPRGDLIAHNLITGFNLGLQMSENSMYNIIQGNTIAYRMGGSGFNINNDTNQMIDNTTVPLP